MKKSLTLIAIIGLYFLNGCQKHEPAERCQTEKTADASVAISWYRLQLRFLLERNSSLNGVYFGYLGIGLYESVRNSSRTAISLSSRLYQMPQMPQTENRLYHWPECANAAMASMLKAYNTGLTAANIASIDSLENVWNQKFKTEASSIVFLRSQSYGQSVASAVYNWSVTDNFNGGNAGFIPKSFLGAWVPTFPAFANGINPYVSAARPFLAVNSTSIAPPFPATYSTDHNSDFYKIVKQVYDINKSLTTEQKNIALFFVDQGNGTGFTPPGHDFSVITQVVEKLKLDLLTAAEVYAKVGIAERDATIVCFRSKYEYSLLRPITYIRQEIEPGWVPFLTTPPHPEYPAAHAFITGAVMQAATAILGPHVGITDHTYDFRGWAPRSYSSLFNVAEEAGISRLYGGIHYLPSIKEGLNLGHNLGQMVGNIRLQYGHNFNSN